MLDMQQAAEHVLFLAERHGLKEVDALIEREDALEVEIREGKVEKVEQSTSLGLGVRVLRDGKTGLASTERLDADAIERAFQSALENSELQDPTEVLLPEAANGFSPPESLEIYNSNLENLTSKDLAELGLVIEGAAKNADTRVSTIPYLGVSRNSSELLLVNTKGTRYHQRKNSVGAYCGALLQDGDVRKTGMRFWNQRLWNPEAGQHIGEEAVRKGAELLQAQPIPSGKLPVVLDEYVVPRLLGIYFGAFSAESAQKGMSRLKGKLGEAIAIPELTLLDDPHRIGGNRSRFLDAEGIPTQPMPLIENGVFRNFLYHVESGRKDNRTSTGHAGRSYSGGISTRTHNLVWPLGDSTLEQLCAIPEECLLVTQLDGAAGCNPISGDISIGVQGFLYRNGERVQPVDSITIAGNFFDLLTQVKATGNAYQPNLTHLFIPALLVEGFSISG